MSGLRVVFMGTPEFSVGIMESIIASRHTIVGAVTVADKPAGRGQQLRESAVKQSAVSKGIPVLQPLKLKDPAFLEELQALNADVFVVVAFRMLPAEVWKMPAKGTFNLHASLLPDYRGAAPINWAIINGDLQTGVTTFMIDEQIDTGNVIAQQKMDISPNETAGELHDRMMICGGGLVVETLDQLETGTARSLPQNAMEGKTRPAPKLTRENMEIDWSADVAHIHNHVRGLSPYPAAWTTWINAKGEKKQVKIYATSVAAKDESMNFPGALIPGKNAISIQCKGGMLEILEFQIEGKKRMSARDWQVGNSASEWTISL
jgi:methionyl-tRNA formyltransferase